MKTFRYRVVNACDVKFFIVTRVKLLLRVFQIVVKGNFTPVTRRTHHNTRTVVPAVELNEARSVSMLFFTCLVEFENSSRFIGSVRVITGVRRVQSCSYTPERDPEV